jgi:hypothetical protein
VSVAVPDEDAHMDEETVAVAEPQIVELMV